jgi:hypothetical protein
MNQPITDAASAFRVHTALSASRSNIQEGEVAVPNKACRLRNAANMSKVDTRTENDDAALDIESAKNLVSLSQRGTTSVDVTDEESESLQAQRSRNRGRSKNNSSMSLLKYR